MMCFSHVKETVKKLVKMIVFVFLFLLLLFVLCHIFARPHGIDWANETGMDLIYKYDGQYDVCFAGTSMVIANITNQELYDKYGFSSVSVGEPQQPIFLTKYTISDVLRHQHPKVIFVDSRSLFYSEERIRDAENYDENYFIHYSLDPIRSFDIKKEALEQIEKQYKEVDNKEYYFRMYNRHSQWRSLEERNFENDKDPSCINGNIMLTSLYNLKDVVGMEGKTISEQSRREIQLVKEECEKHGVDLVLITGYAEPDRSNRDLVRQVAEENHIDYLDFNEVMDEIGFEDLMYGDVTHFNIVGATLWTDYIGEYLSERYSCRTHSENMIRLFEEQSGRYSEYFNCVSNKLLFEKNYSFKEFLSEIIRSDLRDTSILVAVSEDAYGSLDDEGKELLQQIGFIGPQCLRGSFGAAYVTETVYQENAEKEKVILSGEDGDIQYNLESRGANCDEGPGASIIVNGEEYAKGQRGLNIVLFDNKIGELIASKCFDTSSEPDPIES